MITNKYAEEAARTAVIAAEQKSNQQMQEQLTQMANFTQQNTTMVIQINALTDIICNLENRINENGVNDTGN